jgi:hypothetical protein
VSATLAFSTEDQDDWYPTWVFPIGKTGSQVQEASVRDTCVSSTIRDKSKQRDTCVLHRESGTPGTPVDLGLSDDRREAKCTGKCVFPTIGKKGSQAQERQVSIEVATDQRRSRVSRAFVCWLVWSWAICPAKHDSRHRRSACGPEIV